MIVIGARLRVSPSAHRAAYGSILILITVVVSSSVFAKSELTREKPTARSQGGWVCDAYGYDREWKTISGARKSAKNDAEKRAMFECSKNLTGCRLSGCWQD